MTPAAPLRPIPLHPVASPCVAPPPPAVPVEALGQGRDTLIALREAARRARAVRLLSLCEAHRAPTAFTPADTIVRILGEVLGRRPVFHAPASAMASFDESWLIRCHAAQRAGDTDSLALLMRSRVQASLRRPFLDLLRAL